MPGWGGRYKPLDKPRRPTSAYAYYVQDQFREQSRGMGVRKAAEIFPILHGDWKVLAPASKAAYIKRAELDKKRYQGEMLRFYEMVRDGKIPMPAKKQRKTYQVGYPRMTKNAFVFFSNQERAKIRAKHPQMPYVRVMKELGRKWRWLDKEEKEKYIQMRTVDARRYKTARNQFNEEKRRQRKLDKIRKDKERLLRLSQKIYGRPVSIADPYKVI